MEATLALSKSWAELGIVVAATLLLLAAATRVARVRAVAMLLVLGLGPVLLVAEIWDSPQLESVRHRHTLLLVGGIVGALVLMGLAAVVVYRPRLLVLFAAAALPFRLPIDLGGSTVNLLVPLYVVVASGCVAYVVSVFRGKVWEQFGTASGWKPARRVGVALTVFVLAYALQALYSSDFEAALKQMVFFYLPFGLLFILLTRLRWDFVLAKQVLFLFAALAAVFVAIGFVEYSTHQLLLNPKVINSNQFESYFRVNSLFFDPNIYGRFLAIVMLSVAAALLWETGRVKAGGYAALLVVLWAGLVLTFSQSSFGALLVGLAVLAALRWRARYALLTGVSVAALGIVVVLLFPGAIKLDLQSSKSFDKASSGRFKLVDGGLELFSERPIAGYGAGSFAHEYRHQRKASSERAASASHTIPVTVAAEQGGIGLVLYLVLGAISLATLLPGAGRSAARSAVAAAFVALLVHTLFYAAFLEDPLSWALLAAGVGLVAGRRGEDRSTQRVGAAEADSVGSSGSMRRSNSVV